VQNLALFSTSLEFEPPVFENAARYLNSETNSASDDELPMSLTSLVKFGPRTPENVRRNCPTSIKLYGENVLNRQ